MSGARTAAAASVCLGIGMLLIFLVDLGVARIAGVPLVFAGIAVGVAAIATPEFCAGDREDS